MRPYPITLTLIVAAIVVVVLNVRNSEHEKKNINQRETRSVAFVASERVRPTRQNIPTRPLGERRSPIQIASSQLEAVDSQEDNDETPILKGYDRLTDGEKAALNQRIEAAAATPDTADDREVMRQMHSLSLPVQ